MPYNSNWGYRLIRLPSSVSPYFLKLWREIAPGSPTTTAASLLIGVVCACLFLLQLLLPSGGDVNAHSHPYKIGSCKPSSKYTGSEKSEDINKTNEKTLMATANWTPNIYKVTLNHQSGSSSVSAIYEKYATGWYNDANGNTSITTISKPTRINYVFKGYYTQTSCGGTQKIDANGKILAGNKDYTNSTSTLYACWSAATIFDISNMQDMDSTICANTTTPNASATTTTSSHSTSKTLVPRTTLKDTRDNNTYIISKLADGNCWMNQNLRLVGSRTLTSSNSNVSKNFILPASNWNGASNQVSAYLYDTGNATYAVYYNYFAATAGTISGTSNSTDAVYDICPKGWRIPSHSEQEKLLSTYNISNDSTGVNIMTATPESPEKIV